LRHIGEQFSFDGEAETAGSNERQFVYDRSSRFLPGAATPSQCSVRYPLLADGFGNGFPQTNALTDTEG
jgi:hypothetical protein